MAAVDLFVERLGLQHVDVRRVAAADVAAAGAGGDHERARVRDRERAAGERGVQGVEVRRRELVVRDHVHACRPPGGRQPERDPEPADPASGADLGDGGRDV
jgi:hypothetical protein